MLLLNLRDTKMMTYFKKSTKGQGVIEYAGALVIAAVLVATVMVGGEDALFGFFNETQTAIFNFFSEQADTIGH